MNLMTLILAGTIGLGLGLISGFIIGVIMGALMENMEQMLKRGKDREQKLREKIQLEDWQTMPYSKGKIYEK